MQGKELPGSDRGPMRIQFSRNPLGEFAGKRRRDDAGGYGLPYGAGYDAAAAAAGGVQPGYDAQACATSCHT